MTAPTPDPTPGDKAPETPAPSPNAPAFVNSHDAEVLREIARLSKERDDAVAEADRAKARAKELESTMTEAEKAALEKRAADAEAEVQRLKTEQETSTRKAALTDKVADADLALKILDPAKHLNPDGSVKIDALLADHPILTPTVTSPDGGGGKQGGGVPALDTALASGSTGDINAAFDAALKGGN